MFQSSALDVSHSTNPGAAALTNTQSIRRRGRPVRARNPNQNNQIDYVVIQEMIEQTVTRVVSSLNLSARSHPTDTQTPHSPSHVSAASTRSVMNNMKAAEIIQKWNLHFDESVDGLGVEEFIYRVKSLTDETLDSDFAVLCKYIHVLFAGKARDWYWRYHKQVDRMIWSELCASLRQHYYRDYRSDFMSKELIKARKQKLGESFAYFYDAVAGLIDKPAVKIEEDELIEILKNNLLPETRQKLLNQPVHSVGHLRRLVQMSENLVYELSCRADNITKPKAALPRRQVYAVAEVCSEVEDDPEPESALAALRSANFKC